MPARILVIFFLLCRPFLIISEARDSATVPQALQQFISRIDKEKEALQGGAMAIIYQGKVIYKAAFGNCKGSKGSITYKTPFPLASTSKPVTAVSLAMMAEKGLIHFEEKQSLPYLHESASFKEVLSHTTGYSFDNAEIERGVSRPTLLGLIKKKKPNCRPGGCYSYSNVMFSAVEDLLKAKGSSLEAALAVLNQTLQTRVMSITSLTHKDGIAYPHAVKEGKIIQLPFPPYYPKVVASAAGYFASLDDMVSVLELAMGLRADRLSETTRQMMLNPICENHDTNKWTMLQWPIPIKKVRSFYALGWRILKHIEKPNDDLIFHPGFLGGVRSVIGFIPSKKVGLVILINQDSRFHFQKILDFWATCISLESPRP